MNVVFVAAWFEQEDLEPPPWGDPIPIWVRRVSGEVTPDVAFLARMLALWSDREDSAAQFGLDRQGLVVALSLSGTDWRSLLGSGRPPTPGRFEALAGELAGDTFTLDGVSFCVTGRIRRDVPGFTFAYAVPDDESLRTLFADNTDAVELWLGPDGLEPAEEDEALDPDVEEVLFWGAFLRSDGKVTAGVVAGLMLMVVGGAIAQVWCVRRLGERTAFFSPIGRPLCDHPKLLWAMHGTHYGAAFGMMAVAWLYPRANVHVVSLIQGIFAHGELSHIGSAYTSGDIFRAAWTTFQQNYLNQTLQLCIVPSLVIPFAGLMKNLISFALVGFAMAPIWVGAASRLTFHSLTMVLELEAYILASFMVVLFPVLIVRGFRDRSAGSVLAGAVRMMVHGSVLLGILLALAALYEATSLIVLG